MLWREPARSGSDRGTTEEQTTIASGEFRMSLCMLDFAGAGYGALVVFKPCGLSLGNLGQNPANLLNIKVASKKWLPISPNYGIIGFNPSQSQERVWAPAFFSHKLGAV